MRQPSAPPSAAVSLSSLHAAGRAAFVERVGPIFEHSPWIAERAWDRRPFADRVALLAALLAVVAEAAEAEQLNLVRAHPDLAGRLARQGRVTADSAREQAAAGLAALTPEQLAEIERLNEAYQARFGFPFVICARLNNVETIVRALRERVNHGRDTELAVALEEIGKIAALRLAERVE
jgi:OHCU decarboxylase